MLGDNDLASLLADLSPELRPGRYVFTTVAVVPPGVDPVVTVREDEGTTLVLEQDQADRIGLDYDYVAAMITLRVHSSLAAVGLTAAVAGKLAEAGLSCNVVAGFHHDHLFVPHQQGQRARDVLSRWSRNQGAGSIRRG